MFLSCRKAASRSKSNCSKNSAVTAFSCSEKYFSLRYILNWSRSKSYISFSVAFIFSRTYLIFSASFAAICFFKSIICSEILLKALRRDNSFSFSQSSSLFFHSNSPTAASLSSATLSLVFPLPMPLSSSRIPR